MSLRRGIRRAWPRGGVDRCLTSRRAKLYIGTLKASQSERARPSPEQPGDCREGRAGRPWSRRPDYLIGIFRGRSCDIFERPRKGTHAPGGAFSAKTRLTMIYRDIEYTVVQGIERGVWKWSASVAGVVVWAKRRSNLRRWPQPRKAIDRALTPKKCGACRARTEPTPPSSFDISRFPRPNAYGLGLHVAK